MKDRMHEILDELLARMEAGESIEERLAGLPPAEAEELRASLRAALALRALRHVPPPRPEVRRRIRAEVLARAAETPAKPAWSFPIARRQTAWAIGAIVALVLLAAGVWQYSMRWQALLASAPGPAATQLAGLVNTPVPTVTPAQPSPTPPASESPTPPAAFLSTPKATRTPAQATAVPLAPSPSPTPSPVVITPAPTLTPTVVPTPTFTPMPTPTPEPPLPTPTQPPSPPAPTQPPPTPTLVPTPTATEPPTPTPAQTAEPEPTFVATLVPAAEPTATPAR